MKIKNLFPLLFCFVMLFALSVSAYADYDGAIPASEAVVSATWHVTTNGVNLRSGPGTNYATGGQVNYGDTFIYLGGAYGSGYYWYHVTMTSGNCAGMTGYIVSSYASYS